ncbi:MAG: hypothetical protein PUB76_09635 [Oscillospiraceae bacterium]|nr:hypothetical protein [Oscillospiraceae bacterium]MDD6086205.1 hypothetical protein [Oscillospiraceae bacterium]MDY3257826.1 hypothetical protein [Ruminococcus callidus]
MKLKSMVTGLAAAATAGTICYMISDSGSRQKNNIKKDAKKTLKSAVNLCEDFASIFF